MTAEETLLALRQRGVVLSVSEKGGLAYQAPGKLPAPLLAALKEHKEAILAAIRPPAPPRRCYEDVLQEWPADLVMHWRGRTLSAQREHKCEQGVAELLVFGWVVRELLRGERDEYLEKKGHGRERVEAAKAETRRILQGTALGAY